MGNENPVEVKKDGITISTKTLLLTAAGAAGTAIALFLGRHFQKFKPSLVEVAKEGYGFVDWVTEKLERAKEDLEDLLAEAKHAYYEERIEMQELIRREREILEKIENRIKQNLHEKEESE